ncbi:MAG TPA: endonuclease/exonuclease/phosphatase family protein [Puia sp.]|uniref:endonuclease/exonuclease/phosphatase family protein n=1 Tax=Puia sp. TaxID=2045100 RepID=UPI002BE3E3CF|nr:endonuclease/exonuclease/phosphatase family protein [Puia sp.]HVU94158.1 endonuclease/exonuclease/phosphatase family protein [Puia sp.]
MRRCVVIKWFGIIFWVFLSSCRALNFYGDANRPIFDSGQKEIESQEPSDSLNVVTFNIKKARKIQLAISEMKELERKTPVDIYLLQEMNEEGVEAIATGLGLNYLYIPIAYDRSDKKDIGNAILTRGTIEHPEKLILPHAKWQNQQRRSVTIGEVNIHQKKILVFSVHTETVAMSRKMRADQVDSVIRYGQQEAAHYKYVLIGGDFNTAFRGYSRSVVNKFNSNGFNWQTSRVGSTAKAMMGLVSPVNDYLFSKGFVFKNAYVIRDSKSSDHYPVFATLRY